MSASSTVAKEAQTELTYTINERVDNAQIRAWQLRTQIISRSQKRLKNLWKRVEVLSLQGNVDEVKKFYSAMSKDPTTRAKLVELKKRKRTRQGLMPETRDMIILSEAIALGRGDGDLHFLSKDGDFCEFTEEIEVKYGLKVLSVEDALQFKVKLERSIQ